MSHSLSSLKGVMSGIIYGITIGVSRGDARTSDYSLYTVWDFGFGVQEYYARNGESHGQDHGKSHGNWENIRIHFKAPCTQ